MHWKSFVLPRAFSKRDQIWCIHNFWSDAKVNLHEPEAKVRVLEINMSNNNCLRALRCIQAWRCRNEIFGFASHSPLADFFLRQGNCEKVVVQVRCELLLPKFCWSSGRGRRWLCEEDMHYRSRGRQLPLGNNLHRFRDKGGCFFSKSDSLKRSQDNLGIYVEGTTVNFRIFHTTSCYQKCYEVTNLHKGDKVESISKFWALHLPCDFCLLMTAEIKSHRLCCCCKKYLKITERVFISFSQPDLDN